MDDFHCVPRSHNIIDLERLKTVCIPVLWVLIFKRFKISIISISCTGCKWQCPPDIFKSASSAWLGRKHDGVILSPSYHAKGHYPIPRGWHCAPLWFVITWSGYKCYSFHWLKPGTMRPPFSRITKCKHNLWLISGIEP